EIWAGTTAAAAAETLARSSRANWLRTLDRIVSPFLSDAEHPADAAAAILGPTRRGFEGARHVQGVDSGSGDSVSRRSVGRSRLARLRRLADRRGEPRTRALWHDRGRRDARRGRAPEGHRDLRGGRRGARARDRRLRRQR